MMFSRRMFLGAVSGVAAVAAVTIAPLDQSVPGWQIHWSGWREPHNQFVKFGFWVARQHPMPEDNPLGYYSTTLGAVGEQLEFDAIDVSRWDRTAPIRPSEPAERFDAAKAWARARLMTKLESL